MQSPKRIYYARPQYMIGTARDQKNLAVISRLYPGAQVDAVTKEECEAKKGQKDSMVPFFKRVDKSGMVIAVESQRGHFSSGVCAESLHAKHDGKPVMLLRNGALIKVKALDVIDKPVRGGKWAKVTTHSPT